jgi:hypothetical protein
MPRVQKRMIGVRDDMVRDLAELGPIFADFEIVEIGEGEERNVVLIAKKSDEKQLVSDLPLEWETTD